MKSGHLQSPMIGCPVLVAVICFLLGACKVRTTAQPTAEAQTAAMLQAADRGWRVRGDDLLQQGVSTNIADANGRTPLRSAAAGGHERLVHYFVGNGAAVNAQNMAGNTTLHPAAVKNHDGTIRELPAGGASRTIRNWQGQTPADMADPKVRPLVQP